MNEETKKLLTECLYDEPLEYHCSLLEYNMSDFVLWLFCFSEQDYEERCEMVARWLKEDGHASKT